MPWGEGVIIRPPSGYKNARGKTTRKRWDTSASMQTLFRFLMVLGVIAGVVSGSLYVLAEYFQPQPKEISKSLRNVKVRTE